MDILGIGIQEIIFILIIALIIFGPKDIVKAGQSAGKFLRKLITSPTWQTVQKTSRDLRNLPNKLIREAGLEEAQKDLQKMANIADADGEIAKFTQEIGGDLKKVNAGLSAWTTPSPSDPPSEKPARETPPPPQKSEDN